MWHGRSGSYSPKPLPGPLCPHDTFMALSPLQPDPKMHLLRPYNHQNLTQVMLEAPSIPQPAGSRKQGAKTPPGPTTARKPPRVWLPVLPAPFGSRASVRDFSRCQRASGAERLGSSGLK